jgi:hypothetical protein
MVHNLKSMLGLRHAPAAAGRHPLVHNVRTWLGLRLGLARLRAPLILVFAVGVLFARGCFIEIKDPAPAENDGGGTTGSGGGTGGSVASGGSVGTGASGGTAVCRDRRSEVRVCGDGLRHVHQAERAFGNVYRQCLQDRVQTELFRL